MSVPNVHYEYVNLILDVPLNTHTIPLVELERRKEV